MGKLCLECDEPIEEDQQGTFYLANPGIPECADERHLVWVEMTSVEGLPVGSLGTEDGPEEGHTGQVGMNPVHKECGFRAVSGGIGHFEDHNYWCQTVHDPDGGRSVRQSSLEVWARTVRITHSQEN